MQTKTWQWGLCTGLLLGQLASPAWTAERSGSTNLPRYSIDEIPFPADQLPQCSSAHQTSVYARRSNEAGKVVGHVACYVETTDLVATFQLRRVPITWSRTTGVLVLTDPRPADAIGRHINQAGTVVIQAYEAIPPLFYSSPVGVFLWTGESAAVEVTDYNSCSGSAFEEGGINDAGTMAFRSRRYDISGYCRPAVVLRRTNGDEVVGPNMRTYDLSNQEVAVGAINGQIAAKWSPTLGTVPLSDAPPPPDGFRLLKPAMKINSRGDIVGYDLTLYDSGGIAYAAMLWPSAGGEIVLPGLAGLPSASAWGINDKGEIVGISDRPLADNDDMARATIWLANYPRDLNSAIPSDSGIQLKFASSINNSGRIVASGVRPDEPKKPCPAWVDDPETGQRRYDTSRLCRNGYSFVLTPQGQ